MDEHSNFGDERQPDTAAVPPLHAISFFDSLDEMRVMRQKPGSIFKPPAMIRNLRYPCSN